MEKNEKIEKMDKIKKWTKLQKLQNWQNVKPGKMKQEGRINAKTKILLQVD